MFCGGRVIIKVVGRLGGAKGLTEGEIERLPGYVKAASPTKVGRCQHAINCMHLAIYWYRGTVAVRRHVLWEPGA